ncbi:hypothetical protein ACWIWK_00255 [Helicobacter sp. 23-1048]
MLKAENNIGNVKKANTRQLKRHISQIDGKGLKILIDKFNKIDISKTAIDKHLLAKKTISFNKQDIDNLLYQAKLKCGGGGCNNMIVEYNMTYLKDEQKWDERLVLRDDKVLQTTLGKQNLCIVLSLTQNIVVTAWYNLPKDKHKTIDINRYCPYRLKGI